MVMEHKHYRGFLKAVLAERQDRNRSYSLRAFARDLGVPASHLSMVLNQKAHLSPERAESVADRLELSAADAEYFKLLVEYEQAVTADARATLEARLRAMAGQRAPHDLSVDAFKVISDWYHFPLLMLTDIPGEKITRESVAQRLGISLVEADVAIERLERMEMLERLPDGTGRRWEESARVVSQVPNTALRKYHRQMLEKASSALEEQAPSERYVGSETVAIAPEHLPIVRDEIERFRAALVERLNAAARERAPTEVYHLSLSFFRLTNPAVSSRSLAAKPMESHNE